MLTGLILAGGPSKRMNGDLKPLLPFGGELLIERQVKTMRECCQEVIVVTKDPVPLLPRLDRDVRILNDFFSVKGPLAGMHAGFSLAKHGDIWVAGCDMPFLSVQAAELLLKFKKKGFEAAIPRVNGNLYPLHGVYDRACGDKLDFLLENGESSFSVLLEELNRVEIPQPEFARRGIDPCFVWSIDTREDYEKALLLEKAYPEPCYKAGEKET